MVFRDFQGRLAPPDYLGGNHLVNPKSPGLCWAREGSCSWGGAPNFGRKSSAYGPLNLSKKQERMDVREMEHWEATPSSKMNQRASGILITVQSCVTVSYQHALQCCWLFRWMLPDRTPSLWKAGANSQPCQQGAAHLAVPKMRAILKRFSPSWMQIRISFQLFLHPFCLQYENKLSSSCAKISSTLG